MPGLGLPGGGRGLLGAEAGESADGPRADGPTAFGVGGGKGAGGGGVKGTAGVVKGTGGGKAATGARAKAGPLRQVLLSTVSLAN